MIEKIIKFEQYCPTCVHKDVDENEIPCCKCIAEPARFQNSVPLHYSEDSQKKVLH